MVPTHSDSKPPSRVLFLFLGALMGVVATAAAGGWWLYTRATAGQITELFEGSRPKLPRPASSLIDLQFRTSMATSPMQDRVVEKLEARIGKATTFNQVAFGELLEFYVDFTGLNIDLALPEDEARTLRERVITLDLPDVQVKSILGILFDAADLEWSVEDSGLVLYRHERAPEHLRLATYPISDIIARPWTDAEQRRWRELIQMTVDPSSWTTATIATLGPNEAMVARQSYVNHQSITSLLEQLRAFDSWAYDGKSWRVYHRLSIPVSSFAWPDAPIEQIVAQFQRRLGVAIELDSNTAAQVDLNAVKESAERITQTLGTQPAQPGWELLWDFAAATATRPVLINGVIRLKPAGERRNGYVYPPLSLINSQIVEQIQTKLSEPASLQFANTPLSDVLDFVRDYVGKDCPLVLDPYVLIENQNILTTQVSFHGTPAPLRSALARMLDPMDLDPVVRNEVLLITARSRAERWFDTRVYPIGHLVPPLSDEEPNFDVTHWKELIESSVSPSSWASRGGGGAIEAIPHRLALVIRQTEHGHREIVDLLDQLGYAALLWKQPK